MSISPHVKFELAKNRPGWRVDNKHEGYEIGYVEWFPDWSCFIFAPLEQTVYSADCLRDIAEFCESKTKARAPSPQS